MWKGENVDLVCQNQDLVVDNSGDDGDDELVKHTTNKK